MPINMYSEFSGLPGSMPGGGLGAVWVQVTAEDGTWGLVRASSNKPELVVVVESPVSEERLHAMFKAVDGVLRENPEVGAYNQTL